MAFTERTETQVTAAVRVAVQIQRKTAHQISKTGITDLRTPELPVNSNPHRNLALSSESFAYKDP
jgi:hypothetical protein